MDYFSDLCILAAHDTERCGERVETRVTDTVGLSYIVAGQIDFAAAGDEPAVLGPGTVYWTWPGLDVRLGPHGGAYWQEMWLVVTGPRTRRWLETGLLPRTASPFQHLRLRHEFGSLFRQVLSLDRPAHAADQARRVHLIEGMLLALNEDRRLSCRRGPVETGILDLSDRIRRTPFERYRFVREAARLGVSYSRFRRLFRQLVHRPPHEWVLHWRMQAAARLIERSEGPVHRLAAGLGYDNYRYFARLFRKHIGLSPRGFRRSLPPARNVSRPASAINKPVHHA